MYIRTLFFSFFLSFLRLFSSLLVPHCFIAVHAHKYFVVFFFFSLLAILCPAFCLLSSFHRKCAFLLGYSLTPFSILGHFLCFLVRCVCDVYGYCNVFVCVLVWIIFLSFLFFFSLLSRALSLSFHCCYFSGFDLFCVRFSKIRVCQPNK